MNLDLPYRWRPLGTRTLFQELPEPGSLIAMAHAVWRVTEVAPVPVDQWEGEERKAVETYGAWRKPHMVVVRPAQVTSDDPRARDHDVHLRCRGSNWEVYPDEHYPVCAVCSGPLPCREQMAAQVSEAAAKQMDRFSTDGVCPYCQEPITTRQKSITFTGNLEIPGGPPVTFHLRGSCRWSAVGYEKRWVAADPNRRRTRLTCPGHVINHNDGTYECTELTDCRGPRASHSSYSVCRCPDCHAGGGFDCHPSPNAELLRRDVS